MATRPSDPTRAEDQYHKGLAELHRYLFHFEWVSLPRAVEAFRVAANLVPDNAEYWVGLGYALDASDLPEEALVAFRHAAEVSPEDEEVEVFILTLRSELGPEPEALAAVEALAKRGGVDLIALREELTVAGMPDDARSLLMNGFIHARNFTRSRLEDAIERSQRIHDPEKWAREAESDQHECTRMQEELRDSIDPVLVPSGLHEVTPWAIRLGVGDDVCRSRLVENLTADERSTLLDLIQVHAPSVHVWLDAFGDQPMTTEAAAFMYLLLGLEETNTS